MALVIFEDGSASLADAKENPEFFDELGRPNHMFMQSMLETANIGALTFFDPDDVIYYQGVSYSLVLIDSDAADKHLRINALATTIAIKTGLIEKEEKIRGSVIFVAAHELG